jgi:hypothetical protein
MFRAHGEGTPAVSTRREHPAFRQRHSRSFPSPAVPPARVASGFAEAPENFDALVNWFDRFSAGLVLLDEISLMEVREAVAAMANGIAAHRLAHGPAGTLERSRSADLASLRRILRSDHDRFDSSVQQLRWLLAIVERDDHGGNRQALGQYGRLVCEALRRHRVEEREAELLAGALASSAGTARAPGQR